MHHMKTDVYIIKPVLGKEAFVFASQEEALEKYVELYDDQPYFYCLVINNPSGCMGLILLEPEAIMGMLIQSRKETHTIEVRRIDKDDEDSDPMSDRAMREKVDREVSEAADEEPEPEKKGKAVAGYIGHARYIADCQELTLIGRHTTYDFKIFREVNIAILSIIRDERRDGPVKRRELAERLCKDYPPPKVAQNVIDAHLGWLCFKNVLKKVGRGTYQIVDVSKGSEVYTSKLFEEARQAMANGK